LHSARGRGFQWGESFGHQQDHVTGSSAPGTYRLLQLVPPRAAEAIELPVWAVRRWLSEQRANMDAMADIPVSGQDDNETSRQANQGRQIFRWTGDEDSSQWILPKKIHPGDTLVIPAAYGGIDEYGWKPDASGPVEDVGHKAAEPFASRRFAVRIAPGLLKKTDDEALLAQAIASSDTRNWKVLRDTVKAVGLPETIVEKLNSLDFSKRKVEVYTDIYGVDESGNPRGIVFLAPSGIKGLDEVESDSPSVTENDFAGSLPGFALSLQQHSTDVEQMAERFAKLAGLPEERILDLKLAGYLHDAGKVDARFQT
jgi:CRISPR-associated endonuclease/helicase Cas3